MERDWLRPEQAISVLNTAYRMGSLKTFALQLFAGLSRAEVLPLRWKNVSSQFLRVEETMIVGTGGLEIVPRTKAPARRRIIPMSPFLQDLLRYNRGDDEDFVAANPDGSPMSTMQYEYAQKLMNRNLGFRVGHELRHTFATLLSLTGIPDTHRRQLMGHTGLGITDKVYTHQFAEAAIPYINKVEALALGDEPMPTLVPHEWL
jgi:integrase